MFFLVLVFRVGVSVFLVLGLWFRSVGFLASHLAFQFVMQGKSQLLRLVEGFGALGRASASVEVYIFYMGLKEVQRKFLGAPSNSLLCTLVE